MSLRILSARLARPRLRLRAHPGPLHAKLLSTLPNLPIFRSLQNHDPSSVAVIHSTSNRTFTYGNLVGDVLRAKENLSSKTGKLAGERVAFLAENSYDYVVTLLAIFASNAIALPLSPAFPVGELQYILDNAQAKVLLSTEKYADKAGQILESGLKQEPVLDILRKIEEGAASESVKLDSSSHSSGGMMLYTSGTTNRPKGVLIPESALTAQASSLLKAWNYSANDHLLHLLPLHHIHGVVNAIIAPIFSGSSIEFLYPFNTESVWRRLAAPFTEPSPSSNPKQKQKPITFLTAVPTIYTRLMNTFPSLDPPLQASARKAISPENLRLNISGSAALPTPTKSKWASLSNGNILLERFGMTEVGMALSCGLHDSDRVDGSVGWPLPGVEARLVDTETDSVIEGCDVEGEIQLRGENVFACYWGNEDATRESFVNDHDHGKPWFRTGDVAVRKTVRGSGKGLSGEWATGAMYFIQGRKSVDIIKTGGEKVSALEVERELLSLPQIAEAAVVGLPSEQWGQKVAVVLVLHPEAASTGRNGKAWGPMDMRRALKDRLAGYKIPSEMKVLDSIPRNAMGKVNKKALVKEVFGV